MITSSVRCIFIGGERCTGLRWLGCYRYGARKFQTYIAEMRTERLSARRRTTELAKLEVPNLFNRKHNSAAIRLRSYVLKCSTTDRIVVQLMLTILFEGLSCAQMHPRWNTTLRLPLYLQLEFCRRPLSLRIWSERGETLTRSL
jgi:hypothetical protein